MIFSQIITKVGTKCFLTFILSLLGNYLIFAQPVNEQVYNTNIKTIQLFKKGFVLSDPIITLNSDDELLLCFDELTNDSKSYSYTFIHCTPDWEPSNLIKSEYISGFTTNPINNYTFSFNTTFNYIHYEFTFPNNDVQLLLSGNYIVQVLDDYNDNKVVLSKRFRICEQAIKLIPEVRFPINGAIRNSHQQINIKLIYNDFIINNPNDEVSLYIQQNGRTDNSITNLKPDFIRPGELVYELNKKMIFEGGNEFRWLDIRSTRFLSENIRTIQTFSTLYHADLIEDKPKNRTPYFYKDDTNGRYIISVREHNDPTIEADYIFVHFYLPMEAPLIDGNIYIIGGLTNWELTEKNKMKYGFENMRYELTILLKQGFYNYQYLFVPFNGQPAEIGLLEGTHSIAENDYHIFAYYKGASDNYHRLIGYQSINSIKPIPIQ